MFFINSLRINKKVTVHFFYCCPEHHSCQRMSWQVQVF